VQDPDELTPALEAALASDTVILLDVVTDPDIITPRPPSPRSSVSSPEGLPIVTVLVWSAKG
jgi:thiamine pyrophosphate-dependent acetolactate synthase large subunit-like protein